MPEKQNVLRRASGFLRTLPDFLIIGATKSGTTSLYALITAHPDVLPARVKEVNYFNAHYQKGKWWYRSHFPSALYKRYLSKRRGRRVISGEATSTYIYHPMAPARVKAMLPDVKMIVILRNPVDRAYSNYMKLRMQRESLTFEDAIEMDEDRIRYGYGMTAYSDPKSYEGFMGLHAYLGKGRYAEHLARWLEHFDRDRFLVLTLDELKADPRGGGVIARVFEFLGLEPFDVGSAPQTLLDTTWVRKQLEGGRTVPSDSWRFNVGRYPPMNPDTRRMLVDYFRQHNERLSHLLGRDFGWDR